MKLNAGRGERRRGTAVAWKEVFLHCDTYQSINCRGTDCVDQVDRNVHEQDSEDERQHDGGGGSVARRAGGSCVCVEWRVARSTSDDWKLYGCHDQKIFHMCQSCEKAPLMSGRARSKGCRDGSK